MSHLTTMANVFVRKDLLIKALESFKVQVQEPGLTVYYGGNNAPSDLSVPCGSYSLGFVYKPVRFQERLNNLDSTETTSDVQPVLNAYTPMYDAWDGSVERMFGKNLCQLTAIYYKLLAQELFPGETVQIIQENEEIKVEIEA